MAGPVAAAASGGTGPWPVFDGNWVDVGSMVCAILYMVYRWNCARGQGRRAHKLISKRAGANLANGTALFPLFVLGFSIVSSSLLADLLTANKLILSVAGFCALFALLEDEAEE